MPASPVETGCAGAAEELVPMPQMSAAPVKATAPPAIAATTSAALATRKRSPVR